jgi:hypothetical protein
MAWTDTDAAKVAYDEQLIYLRGANKHTGE